jgi:CRISPR system Cascade subunit CasA
MHNLLEEQVITAASIDGQRSRYSLPGVMAGLVRGSIAGFPFLRTHQRHVWHAFLVQIATLALQHSGEDSLPDYELPWSKLISSLTPEWPNGEPWSLIVSDISRPAVLQAPAPKKDLSDCRVIETPDKLDMLVTSKNHDLKSRRMMKSAPEDWLFALVSLQTQEGIMGAGKYGISRMNGGYGSRPMFGIDLAGNPGFRFRRDVAMLLSLGAEDYNPNHLCRTGLALLWLIPWDGSSSVPFKELHPHYIEICRRVRLGSAGEQIFAMEAASAAPRISGASDLKGNTGDPWTPIGVEGKAFSVNREGFSYRKLADLFNHTKFQLSPLVKLSGNDPAEGVELVAESVCRGQGKTEGYHERRIPIPKKALSAIVKGKDNLIQLTDRRVAALGELRTAFRFGLLVLSQREPNKSMAEREGTRKLVERWLKHFEGAIDQNFFDDLWDEAGAAEGERDGIYAKWLKAQLDFTSGLLSDAPQALTCPGIRRYSARARADIAFRAKLSTSIFFRPYLSRQKFEEDASATH